MARDSHPRDGRPGLLARVRRLRRAITLPGAEPHRESLLHEQVLGPRLLLFARVRFLVAAAIIAAALAGRYLLGVQGLPVGALAIVAGEIALYNIPLFVFARRFARAPDLLAESRWRALLAEIGILLDFLALTTLITLVGGSGSPLFAFYIFHAILAALLLTRRSAWLLCMIGLALYTALLAAELAGVLSPVVPAGAVWPGAPGADWRYTLTVWACQAVMLMMTAWLVTGVADVLRRGEERLRHLNEELDRLSRQRREFMDMAFHDLKAPAAAVLTHLDNLGAALYGPLSDEQLRIIGRCRQRLEGQLEFLHDLLALAHLETPNLAGLMKSEDLGALVSAAAEEAMDLAENRGQELTAWIDPGLPPVLGIERLLRQAVMNYLTNAVKYSPTGGRIELRASAADGWVRIEVRDSGPGIPSGEQHKIFAEFTRIHSPQPQAGKAGSTGLGLAVVKKIALAHGGRVGFDSEPGKGCRFWLELPAAPAGSQPKADCKPQSDDIILIHSSNS